MSQTIVLSCPNCTTRFSAPAAQFLPNGRQVRCSQCQHVWFNAAPTGMVREGAAPIPATAASASAAASTPVVAPAAAAAATSDTPPPPPPATRDGSRSRRRLRKRRTRRGVGLLSLLLWLIALCLLAAILTYIFREPLRRAMPHAAPWIDSYTGTVDTTAQGLIGRTAAPAALEFSNIRYDVKEYESGNAILVEADLTNGSDDDVAAPTVSVSVVDADGAELQNATMEPEDGTEMIGPKKAVRYFMRIGDPPAEFDRVLLNIE